MKVLNGMPCLKIYQYRYSKEVHLFLNMKNEIWDQKKGLLKAQKTIIEIL